MNCFAHWTSLQVHVFPVQTHCVSLEAALCVACTEPRAERCRPCPPDEIISLLWRHCQKNVAHLVFLSCLKFWFANEKQFCNIVLFSKGSILGRFGFVFVARLRIIRMCHSLNIGKMLWSKVRICNYLQRVAMYGTRNLMYKFNMWEFKKIKLIRGYPCWRGERLTYI